MKLQQKFAELLITIGFKSSQIEVLWLDLEKAYSGKSRHYHTLTHLEEMVVLFDSYHMELQFPNEVLYSIFYHDYVYKVTRKDNEQKSAEKAVSILPTECKLDKDMVFSMICATQLHQHNQVDDINWLIDFDLKVLSKDWDDYQLYAKQIRNEYRLYPNFMYKPGRKKVLEHFLTTEFVYQTDEFRRKFEKSARRNIQDEIELLR